MTAIDLEEVKKKAVHDGVLEAICLLRETREKIYTLLEDEGVTGITEAEGTLTRMMSSLCDYTYDLCDIISVIFSERADEAIGKAIKRNKQ